MTTVKNLQKEEVSTLKLWLKEITDTLHLQKIRRLKT